MVMTGGWFITAKPTLQIVQVYAYTSPKMKKFWQKPLHITEKNHDGSAGAPRRFHQAFRGKRFGAPAEPS